MNAPSIVAYPKASFANILETAAKLRWYRAVLTSIVTLATQTEMIRAAPNEEGQDAVKDVQPSFSRCVLQKELQMLADYLAARE